MEKYIRGILLQYSFEQKELEILFSNVFVLKPIKRAFNLAHLMNKEHDYCIMAMSDVLRAI